MPFGSGCSFPLRLLSRRAQAYDFAAGELAEE